MSTNLDEMHLDLNHCQWWKLTSAK